MTADLPHVLVVDDEPEIRALLQRMLDRGGFRTSVAEDGPSLRRCLDEDPPQLVVLDLRLGRDHGLDLLRELRRDSDVPVIILTGVDAPHDRALGLELGADDYVSKPFEPRELLARVRSVLRRSGIAVERRAEALRFAGWRIELRTRRLTSPCGEEVHLTTAQFDLLAALVAHPGETLSRDQLLALSRQRLAGPMDRSIDVHVGHLRRKLDLAPDQPSLIATVHGKGYRFTAAVEEER